MKQLITPFILLLSGVGIVAPAKALTEEEAAKLSIGVQVLTCIVANGCYGSSSYQPTHYRQPSHRYPHNYHHSGFKNHSNYYPHSKPRYNYNPRITPYQPQYRYSPPYAGYYHNQQAQYRDVRGQINHIYRDVLRRDADLQGLNTYQDRYNNGWSLEDIRRDIYNSHEARYSKGY